MASQNNKPMNSGDDGPSSVAQQEQQANNKPTTTIASSAVITTAPYQLATRAALFQQQYQNSIGCSIQGKEPGLSQLGINPKILSMTIQKLGFSLVSEDTAKEWCATTAPDEEKLNMLLLTSAKCNLHLSGANYLTIKPFVSRMYFMCTKWFLVQSLRRTEERMRRRHRGQRLRLRHGEDGGSFLTGSGRPFSHEEFTPFTLNLNNPQLEEILAEQPGVYLAKPARGSMGQGQQLVHIHQDSVQEDLLDFLLASKFKEMRRSEVILQRYIERPLLVDRRKFDMRVYMLVVNARREDPDPGTGGCHRGYFVFLHPGFLRLCTAPYDPQHSDLAVHLTNQSVQARNSSAFSQLKEVTTWYPDELNQYLNRRRRCQLPKDWVRDTLYPKAGAILGYISAVFRPHLDDRDSRTNTFRILGVDFLVDQQLRLYLLECNSYPSWGRQTSVLNELKPNLWREAACLTAEVALRHRGRQPVRDDLLVTRQNFRLVYSSEDPQIARQNVANMFD